MSTLQHERITALAQELRLHALPDLYGAVAQSAAKRKDASYADFLEEVLKGERDARRVRAREMLTRIAGFPALKTLEAYDFAFASGAPRQQIQELAGLGFVERSENVVLLGPSGVGKTHLAIAIRAARHPSSLEGALHIGGRPGDCPGSGAAAGTHKGGDASDGGDAKAADRR